MFSWRYRPFDSFSGWVNSFVENLGSLNHLKNLSLHLYCSPSSDFSLEPLSRLRTIRIYWGEGTSPTQAVKSQMGGLISRCPDLESFTFTYPFKPIAPPQPNLPITLGDFFTEALNLDVPLRLKELELHSVVVTPTDFRSSVRHFQYLQRLELDWDPDPIAAANFGEIYSILQAERIHLKSIKALTIHPPGVLDYLSSYTGAEHIVLKPEHPLDDSPRLVDRFFSSVLNCHQHSLKSLSLGMNKMTAWSKPLPKEFFVELGKCQSLEELLLHLYLPPVKKAYLGVLVSP